MTVDFPLLYPDLPPATLGTSNLVFVDVETTGASPGWGDRVTELGVVRVENGQVTAEYSQLFNPGRSIPAGIVHLTGITNEMVAGQPSFAEAAETIFQLMRDAVPVGHNVRFDLGLMSAEFERCGINLGEALHLPPVLDTVRIARRMFGPGGNGLQVLSRRLGLNPTVAHRALADAITTKRVLDCLLPARTPLEDALAKQGGSVGWPKPTQADLPLDLADALAARRPVKMRYVDARQAVTERLVQPLNLKRTGRDVMLVAFCHLRQSQRTFRLDRVVSFETIDAS